MIKHISLLLTIIYCPSFTHAEREIELHDGHVHIEPPKVGEYKCGKDKKTICLCGPDRDETCVEFRPWVILIGFLSGLFIFISCLFTLMMWDIAKARKEGLIKKSLAAEEIEEE